jgi:hypothetical protein
MNSNPELVLGIVRGLFGFLIGILQMLCGSIVSIVGFGGMVAIFGMGTILFGIIGIIGAVLVSYNSKAGGALMLITGILGFMTASYFWIIAGLQDSSCHFLPGLSYSPIQGRYNVWHEIENGVSNGFRSSQRWRRACL